MPRREGEVFFFGTAMGYPGFWGNARASGNKPKTAATATDKRSPAVPGGSLLPMIAPPGERAKQVFFGRRRRRLVEDRVGVARKGRQGQRQFLRHRLADIDGVAVERLEGSFFGVQLDLGLRPRRTGRRPS